MRRSGEAAFDVNHPAAAALAIIGRTPLCGALTSAKTALAGTLNQTLAMILHGYLLFILSSIYFETSIVFYCCVAQLYRLARRLQALPEILFQSHCESRFFPYSHLRLPIQPL